MTTPTKQATPPIKLLDGLLAAAGACERPDLQRRLEAAKRRTQSPTVRVLVVGEPSQGKSTLVNALVGAPVCAVGPGTPTRVPTVVREGTTAAAALVYADRSAGGDLADAPLERVPVPVTELPARAAAAAAAPTVDGGRALLRAEVELPRRLLTGGLELVDTAGVGGVGTGAELATLELLPSADAVLLVSDASQEFTAPEMTFLRQAAALCPTVACVLTKTDACPDWRRISDLDRGHLAAAEVVAPVFTVSSVLEVLAVQRKDRELHEESGFGALATHLRREVVDRAETLARRSLVHDLRSVADQLTLALRSELAGLQDPARGEQLVQELEQAREAVEDLRRRSSRWQQVLGDGVTDLMADIEYDLRDRSRVVTREADAAIDAHDPGPLWDDFADWLDRRVAGAVAESFVWATQRSEWLAAQVVEQFTRDGGGALPELQVGDGGDALGALVDLTDIDRGQLKVSQRVLIGMRGSYSGVLMTGLVTSLVGMSLINPISLGAGLVIGSKAYRDDKVVRRQRRQAEAKAAVRRHLDEVVFHVGKQLKDRLRVVQRTLRDLITDTVEEMSRTLAEAHRTAQRAAKTATADRATRIRELRARLEEVERLSAEVSRLAGVGVAA
ncbi:dynamin family protein [uncultured Modestobacter sp.]|uniref:dynamin family protein n=1 Tax=uncultured Modestobacter sp. TaxID=380048 RepID=UPI0026348854|nr:dynamin family protein [uncultured Modestobacter sp.]